MEEVRWGLMGCAGIAVNRVIPALAETSGAVLTAVASRSEEKARLTAELFGAPNIHGSYEALLQDPDVEAIYIPLPNHMHKEWTIASLRAGKHVLCEKPIGLDAREAREMQAVAEETGLLLLEAFMYRFSPVVQRTVEIVRRGDVGSLRTIHSAFSFLIADDPSNIRLQADAGGGSLYDVGCYCINVQRMIAGAEPVSVSAKLKWSEKHNVDMAAAVAMQFERGLLSTFNTGFDAPGSTYLRIVGTDGTIELPDGFLGRGDKARIIVTTEGVVQETTVTLVDAYGLEVQDMSEAIRGAHEPLFAWEPLDATMRVIDACYTSDKSGVEVRV